MGIFRSIALSVTGAALKAVNPKRFKEVTDRGDRQYQLALELVKRGQLDPFTSKLFGSKDDAEAWAVKTHKDLCLEHFDGDTTIFPTIKPVESGWVGSVWVVNNELLSYISENK